MTKFCVGKPSKEGWKYAPLYLKYENISGEVLTKNNFDAIQQEFSHRYDYDLDYQILYTDIIKTPNLWRLLKTLVPDGENSCWH